MKKTSLTLSILLLFATNAWGEETNNSNQEELIDCDEYQTGDSALACLDHLKGLLCEFDNYKFAIINYENQYGWRGQFQWLERDEEWMCLTDPVSEGCREDQVLVDETPDKLTFTTAEYVADKEEKFEVDRFQASRVAILTVNRYDLKASLNFKLSYVGAPQIFQYRYYGAETTCKLISKPRPKERKI